MSLSRRDFVKSASIGAGLASVLEIVPDSAESTPTASQGSKIINLDDRVSFKQQLGRNVGLVVLMSDVSGATQSARQLSHGLQETVRDHAEATGFISAKLHRGIAGGTSSHKG